MSMLFQPRPVVFFEALPDDYPRFRNKRMSFWDENANATREAYCDGLRWWKCGPRGNYLDVTPAQLLSFAANLDLLPLGAVFHLIAPTGATGLTRPPTSTRLNNIWLVVDTDDVDGVTRVLKPLVTQNFFMRPGNITTPAIAAYSLTAATGIISEMFQTYANCPLIIPGTQLDIDMMMFRGTGATGTPVYGLTVGATTIAVASAAANVNSITRVNARMTCLAANSQFTTYTVAPSNANNSKGNVASAIDFTAAQTWAINVGSGGTSGETHGVAVVDIKLVGR